MTYSPTAQAASNFRHMQQKHTIIMLLLYLKHVAFSFSQQKERGNLYIHRMNICGLRFPITTSVNRGWFYFAQIHRNDPETHSGC